MDEIKIDKIIKEQEKQIDKGHKLKGKGREKYDIEFNLACMDADFKKVKELSETQYCDGYFEGLIALCSADNKDQKYSTETFQLLADKAKKFLDQNRIELIRVSLRNNNVTTLSLLLNDGALKYFIAMWLDIFDPKKFKNDIGVDACKFIINQVTSKNFLSQVDKKEVKNVKTLLRRIKEVACKNRNEKVFDLLPLNIQNTFLEQKDSFFHSGFYLPTKRYIEAAKTAQDKKSAIVSVSISGNLTTVKKIFEDFGVLIENEKIPDYLILAYVTNNENGVELVKYLEQYYELKMNHIKPISQGIFASIIDPKIMSHALDKYGHQLTDKEKIELANIQSSKSEKSWIIYDKLLRNFPTDELLVLSSYKVHKELSKKEKYYEKIFMISIDNMYEFVNVTIKERIYEIVFSDIKNVPQDFNYGYYLSWYEMHPDIEIYDFLIFFRNYFIKNKIVEYDLDINSLKRIQKNIKDDPTEIEELYFHKIDQYTDAKNIMEDEIEDVIRLHQKGKIDQKETSSRIVEINQTLIDTQYKILRVNVRTELNKIVKEAWNTYNLYLHNHPNELNMHYYIFSMIVIVESKIPLIWNDLLLLENLSSNTLYELGPYLHKILPEKKEIFQIYKKSFDEEYNKYVENDVVEDEKQLKKEITKTMGNPSIKTFPKIKAAYNRYMSVNRFTKLALKFSSVVKGGRDIQKHIIDYL